MRALVSFIMRGRMQAALAALGFMALALIFPLFSYVSGGVVGLVALRKGMRESAFVIGVALVFMAGMAVATDQPAVGVMALVTWMPVWVLALVLRHTTSLSLTLSVAVVMGIVGVVLVYLLIADPAVWWRENVIKVFTSQVLDQAGLAPEQRDIWRALLDRMAAVMTGIVAAAFVFSAIFNLFIARGWQALLYNPGGFKKEFFELRLAKWLAVGVIALLLMSVLPLDKISAVARDALLVVVMLYMVQGLALVHVAVAHYGVHAAWLVALYVLTLLLPQVMVLLALMGFADTWFNLRYYMRQSKPR